MGSLLEPPRELARRHTLTPPTLDVTATFTLDRASFEHLVANPSLCGLEQVLAAIENADYDDAAIRALARIQRGLELPSGLIVDTLVGVERMEVFLALARELTVDALESALDLLRRARFSASTWGMLQTCYLAFALLQLQAPEVVCPVLIPPLRRLARIPWLLDSTVAILGWVVEQIADRHLRAVYREHHDRVDIHAEEAGAIALMMWNLQIDEVVTLLPERARGVPVNATPKVGRNELCPCGSGKKVKRCHADKPSTPPSSPGTSRAERLAHLRALEPRLDAQQVLDLPRAYLAQLDLTRLPNEALTTARVRQALHRDWHRACLVVDEITRRHGKQVGQEHMREVIYEAITVRQYDIAGLLMTLLDKSDVAERIELEVALAIRSPSALERLEKAARDVVASERADDAVGLARAVLRSVPALGILVARGAVNAEDSEALLAAIERERDHLQLPPGDPAEDVFAALGGVRDKQAAMEISDAERARLERETADLRTRLDDATNRIGALQREVADRERQVAVRAHADSTESPGERRAREKVEQLQAQIRESNDDRARLRRELADAIDSKANASTSAARPSDDPDDGMEELPARSTTRPVLLPRFGATAAAAFESLPGNVAANAMRTVGALAAGDTAAWRHVKVGKDMSRQVLMARVGIHHRLLFRTEDGALDVVDLVTRENLQMVLKRLRST